MVDDHHEQNGAGGFRNVQCLFSSEYTVNVNIPGESDGVTTFHRDKRVMSNYCNNACRFYFFETSIAAIAMNETDTKS